MDAINDFLTLDNLLKAIEAVKTTGDPSNCLVMEQIKRLTAESLGCGSGGGVDDDTVRASYFRLEAVQSYVWEKLNTGHWSLVDAAWKELFTLLTVSKVRCIINFIQNKSSDGSQHLEVVRDVIKMCDIGKTETSICNSCYLDEERLSFPKLF